MRGTTLLLAGLLATACSDFATDPDRTPTALQVTPETAVVLAGETVEFQVRVLDQNGVPYDRIPSWSPPRWSSEDPGLLQVDEHGIGLALAPGESRVAVEVAGIPSTALVRTNPHEIDVSVPFVYLTQAVQRQVGDVPIVAGRDALLRVYVRGDGPNYFQPAVRATLYDGDTPVHSERLSLENEGLPESVDVGVLSLSYDATIPGSVLRPGLGLVIEVDPDGILPAVPGSVLRVPETGVLPLDVREVPPFRLRLVPVHQAANGLTSSFSTATAPPMTALTEAIFPLAEVDVDVRAPYTTEERLDTDGGWFQLIEDMAVLRWDDGSDRYYYGGFSRPARTALAGLGYVGYPVAIGFDSSPEVIAHELGHTFNLPHAPCGGPQGVDPDYPYAGGLIGQWGFDRQSGELQGPAERFDLMTYCDPTWISDYNYERVLAYRDTSEFDGLPDPAAVAGDRADQETLLLRGGVLNGQLRLSPVLAWTGPVALPEQEGRYALQGLDAAGAELFSVSLEPRVLDHGDDDAQFLVAVPAEWAGPGLARVRLTGPEGSVEQVRRRGPVQAVPEVRLQPATGDVDEARWDAAEFPLAVVRDRQTGEIRAMSRSGRVVLPGRDPARFDVVLSDGVATRSARLVRP